MTKPCWADVQPNKARALLHVHDDEREAASVALDKLWPLLLAQLASFLREPRTEIKVRGVYLSKTAKSGWQWNIEIESVATKRVKVCVVPVEGVGNEIPEGRLGHYLSATLSHPNLQLSLIERDKAKPAAAGAQEASSYNLLFEILAEERRQTQLLREISASLKLRQGGWPLDEATKGKFS